MREKRNINEFSGNRRVIKESQIYKSKFIDYFLVFLLMQVGFVSFWLGNKVAILLLFFLYMTAFIIRGGPNKFNYKIIILFFIHTTLALIQGLAWDSSILSIITSFSFLVLTSYFVWFLYGPRLFRIFDDLFVVFTGISFFFWLLINISPGIKIVIDRWILLLYPFSTDAWPRSMIIFTHWFQLDNYFLGLSRNAGFLHEPGGFATLLVFFIIYNYITAGKKINYRIGFYAVCLLTTFSTAGYISLFLIAIVFLSSYKNLILRYLGFLIFISIAIIVNKNTNFLGQKLSYQVENQYNKNLTETTSGRFLGFRKSLNVALKYPFYGRGINTISMPDSDEDPDNLHYGWYGFSFRYGLIFGLLFMFFFLKGLLTVFQNKHIELFSALLFLLAILINLSSQDYIGKPLFFIFFLIGINIEHHGKREKKINHYFQRQS